MTAKLTKQEKDSIAKLLLNKVYGKFPEKAEHLNIDTKHESINYAAGHAIYREQTMEPEIKGKIYTIHFTSVIPTKSHPCPAIISLNQEQNVPNKFLPAEEIIDRGYAIFSLCVTDTENADVKTNYNAYKKLVKSRNRSNAPGKITISAYFASLLCDYIMTLKEIDKSAIIISGHAEFAKAALLACGLDDRISFAISNDSLSLIANAGLNPDIGSRFAYDFPNLFCHAFLQDPIQDEHILLLRLCESKNLLIGCSADDIASNYETEYEALMSALRCDRVKFPFEKGKIPTTPLLFEGNSFSYHLRSGTSYFSREDWNIYLDFIDKKLI